MLNLLAIVFLLGSWPIVVSADTNYITTGYGAPISNKDAVLTVGERGPMLLEDTEFIDEMARFNRERIPERLVHAKGAGAFGYFEVTHDITPYCAAALFSNISKRTNIAVRFSTVTGELGSADTGRDPRGFAIKFYTEEGNWDLVGINFPVFFLRDPSLFPSFIHTLKRHPSTNLHDSDRLGDFLTLRPEVAHMLIRFFSDRGTPDGYRYMDGFGVNTFKLVNKAGNYVYCKFHYLSNQGIRSLKVKSSDPDYSARDLYVAIEQGKYPSWTFYIQVMTENEALKAPFNPFDDTKIWPEKYYPLRKVGKIILNRNPTNVFQEVEQAAYSPSHMVPGIKPSPDKILQGRLFVYSDTQRYRLGPNFLQIPVNCPLAFRNYQRDGPMAYNNQGNATNYHPNTVDYLEEEKSCTKKRCRSPPYHVVGDVDKYDSGEEEDNFSQAREFLLSLSKVELSSTIINLANFIKTITRECVYKRVYEMLLTVLSKKHGLLLTKQLNLTNFQGKNV